MSIVKTRPRKRDAARILETISPGLARSQAPCLAVAVGLPASGKSTFCRSLAARTGAVVLESDALRKQLFAKPSHSTEESTRLFSAIYSAADMLLREGASVIIDATNLRERDRQPAYETARLNRAKLLLLHFSAPEDVIAGRLERRNAGADPDDCSTAGMEIYRRMQETQQPVIGEHVQIDTSDPEATQRALTWAASVLTGGKS